MYLNSFSWVDFAWPLQKPTPNRQVSGEDEDLSALGVPLDAVVKAGITLAPAQLMHEL